ncbi:MAG TPA: protein kinase [Ktedonobacteraceae bacterium]|nr:protein kinase [Ktedonobacteraceae bacterium]
MADLTGQQLGNYRIIRLIGRGGFADAYLGEHIYLRTQVAIKVLQAKVANDEDLEGFLKEARTIAHLIHPNIVRVTDFGVEAETPFLVMDYAPKGTLRQRHPKGTIIPITTIIPYVRQVAMALQHAHDEKLVHRDIKPENMLLGRKDEVLLSDFGIALVSQSSRYESTQDVVGTVAYMSPEQIQGKPRPASDQYSLAVVVYEWLSGDRPFHGSFTELCTQHMFASPPPLRERVPGISPDIEHVVTTALAKDPKQRFGSVLAFANALEQANQVSQPMPSPVVKPAPEITPSAPPPTPAKEVAAWPPTQVASPPTPAKEVAAWPPTQVAPPPPPASAAASSIPQAQIAPPPPAYSLRNLTKESPASYGANQWSPGMYQSARTDSDAKVRLWSFGKERLIAALLGIVIFGGGVYVFNLIGKQNSFIGPLFSPLIPSLGTVFGFFFNWYSILFSIAFVIPLLLAVEYGPWVGTVTIVLGSLIGNYLVFHAFSTPWVYYLADALFAFVPGFALLATKGRYDNRKAIVIALVFSVVGILCFCIVTAIGDAVINHFLVSDDIGDFFGDLASFVICLALLPFLLMAFNAMMRRKNSYS